MQRCNFEAAQVFRQFSWGVSVQIGKVLFRKSRAWSDLNYLWLNHLLSHQWIRQPTSCCPSIYYYGGKQLFCLDFSQLERLCIEFTLQSSLGRKIRYICLKKIGSIILINHRPLHNNRARPAADSLARHRCEFPTSDLLSALLQRQCEYTLQLCLWQRLW